MERSPLTERDFFLRTKVLFMLRGQNKAAGRATSGPPFPPIVQSPLRYRAPNEKLL